MIWRLFFKQFSTLLGKTETCLQHSQSFLLASLLCLSWSNSFEASYVPALFFQIWKTALRKISYIFKYCIRGSNQNTPFRILLFETNYFVKLQVSFSVKRSIISKHVQEELYSMGSGTFWKFLKAHVSENLIFLHCP